MTESQQFCHWLLVGREIRLKNFNGAADLFFCAGGTAPGTSQMDSWSGAGQRDYHYSLYNKRKFEEVCIC